MKISSVKTTLLTKPLKRPISDAAREILARDCLLIEVDIEDGLTGLSILTGHHMSNGRDLVAVNGIIQDFLKPLLVGRSPLHTEARWREMFQSISRLGNSGAAIRAISGIDIALWDAKAKAANLPLHVLLGGSKSSVLGYVTGGFFDRDEIRDTERALHEVQQYVELGFDKVKIKIGKDLTSDKRRITALIEKFGDSIKLMLDANEGLSRLDARRVFDFIRHFDIHWVEEPIKSYDIHGYRQLKHQKSSAIALGENLYTRHAFRQFLEEGLVDVVQPDATTVGGVTEWIRIVASASTWGVACVPHAVPEVHLSLVAAVENADMIEYFVKGHDLQSLQSEVVVGPAELRSPEQGKFRLPDSPGFGFVIDRAAVDHYRIGSWE